MSNVEFPKAASEGLVSIVIPTYRADEYIGQALASISRQEYQHWELIVVEDASQGKTEGIVREFARNHSQHRVLYLRNEKNSGPSHSRNVAFSRHKESLSRCWMPTTAGSASISRLRLRHCKAPRQIWRIRPLS